MIYGIGKNICLCRFQNLPEKGPFFGLKLRQNLWQNQIAINYCFCYKYYKELFKNGIHLWIRFNLNKLILTDGLNLKISNQSKCLFYKKYKIV